MLIRPMTKKDLNKVLLIENDSFISPWNEKQFNYELNENPYAILLVADCMIKLSVISMLLGNPKKNITFVKDKWNHYG